MSDNARNAPPPPPIVKRRGPGRVANESIDQKKNRAAALFRGYTLYLGNLGMSIRAVWDTGQLIDDEESPFIRDCVSYSQFERVASTNSWTARRREHWEAVRARVEDHLMTEHVTRELTEIGTLEALKLAVLPHITGGTMIDANGDEQIVVQAKPKSLEGAVKAFVELDKRIGAKRDHVIEETGRAAAGDPHHPEGMSTPGLDERGGPALLMDTDGYDETEIEAMAEALAVSRMEKQNAAHRDDLPVERHEVGGGSDDASEEGDNP